MKNEFKKPEVEVIELETEEKVLTDSNYGDIDIGIDDL